MAKPHRMAALTAGLLIAIPVTTAGIDGWVLMAALVLVLIGSAVTATRRTQTIIQALETR